jgi:L-asparagine transporter-like permease
MCQGPSYRTVFWLQIFFYVLAMLEALSPPTKKLKLVAFADTFVMLNIAAALAIFNFVVRHSSVWS